MAEVKVTAKSVFVNVEPERPSSLATHKLEWVYDVGSWVGITETQAIKTLAIWGVKESAADAYLHMARIWGEYTLEIKPEHEWNEADVD